VGTVTLRKCADNFCRVGCNSTALKTDRCVPLGYQYATLRPSVAPGWALQLNTFGNASGCGGKPLRTQGPPCDAIVLTADGGAYWSDCAGAGSNTAPAVYHSGCDFSGNNCTARTEVKVGGCATVPGIGRVQLVEAVDTSPTLTIDTYAQEWQCSDRMTVQSFSTVGCGLCNTNWAGDGSASWTC
jgi:hypothetical protein